MTFYSKMEEQKAFLRKSGIPSIIPDPDDEPNSLWEKDFPSMKRRSSMKHIRRIRAGKTFGILVMNLDKHGIHDYIGPNTFAEIAIAFAHSKHIFLYQGIPDFYQDELVAWQAIPLNGNTSRLVTSYQETMRSETLQLTLFGL
jgi:hypothetical protein